MDKTINIIMDCYHRYTAELQYDMIISQLRNIGYTVNTIHRDGTDLSWAQAMLLTNDEIYELKEKYKAEIRDKMSSDPDGKWLLFTSSLYHPLNYVYEYAAKTLNVASILIPHELFYTDYSIFNKAPESRHHQGQPLSKYRDNNFIDPDLILSPGFVFDCLLWNNFDEKKYIYTGPTRFEKMLEQERVREIDDNYILALVSPSDQGISKLRYKDTLDMLNHAILNNNNKKVVVRFHPCLSEKAINSKTFHPEYKDIWKLLHNDNVELDFFPFKYDLYNSISFADTICTLLSTTAMETVMLNKGKDLKVFNSNVDHLRFVENMNSMSYIKKYFVGYSSPIGISQYSAWILHTYIQCILGLNNIITMQFTGERQIANNINDIADNHIERYSMANNYIKGHRILDISCGNGYGTYLLAKRNYDKSIVGVDIDKDSISFAYQNYKIRNNAFIYSGWENIDQLGKFDSVVSFEFIEHILEGEEFLQKVYDLLNYGGVLILSTPTFETYKNSPYHVRGFKMDEMIKILEDIGFTIKWHRYGMDGVNETMSDVFDVDNSTRNMFVIAEKDTNNKIGAPNEEKTTKD